MKTTKQFSIMMTIVLLSFSINSCHQQKALAVKYADHTITLEVDTDNITRQNLDSTCKFLPYTGTSNKEYTTKVTFDDTITWEGRSLNGRDSVEIKKIKYKGGPKLLTVDVNRNQSDSPKVHGKVRDSTDVFHPDTEILIEEYLITFKINGKLFRYKIDPKIQVNRNR
jgi:hypothetical protein